MSVPTVAIGQRWQHRKRLRVVVVVGFMGDGWQVCYRTANGPKLKRLSTSWIYYFRQTFEPFPCLACGDLMHGTPDCKINP